MSASNEQQVNNWWAEDDTPVQANSHVSYQVDARSALLTMCRHFLMAQKYIYVAGWGMTPTMKLVRGKDHRTGPDGSPEQEALLAELRAEGLQEAEINFWCSHDLTVQAVLGYMVSKGIEVKAPNCITKDLTLTEGCITSNVTQGTVPLQSGGSRSEVTHEFSKQAGAVAANGTSLSGGYRNPKSYYSK